MVSALARMVPPSPTATKRSPSQATRSRSAEVVDHWSVHRLPSPLVSSAPSSPTATKLPLPQATEFSGHAVGTSRISHSCPSGLDAAHASPTAAYTPPPYATPRIRSMSTAATAHCETP